MAWRNVLSSIGCLLPYQHLSRRPSINSQHVSPFKAEFCQNSVTLLNWNVRNAQRLGHSNLMAAHPCERGLHRHILSGKHMENEWLNENGTVRYTQKPLGMSLLLQLFTPRWFQCTEIAFHLLYTKRKQWKHSIILSFFLQVSSFYPQIATILLMNADWLALISSDSTHFLKFYRSFWN